MQLTKEGFFWSCWGKSIAINPSQALGDFFKCFKSARRHTGLIDSLFPNFVTLDQLIAARVHSTIRQNQHLLFFGRVLIVHSLSPMFYGHKYVYVHIFGCCVSLGSPLAVLTIFRGKWCRQKHVFETYQIDWKIRITWKIHSNSDILSLLRRPVSYPLNTNSHSGIDIHFSIPWYTRYFYYLACFAFSFFWLFIHNLYLFCLAGRHGGCCSIDDNFCLGPKKEPKYLWVCVNGWPLQH